MYSAGVDETDGIETAPPPHPSINIVGFRSVRSRLVNYAVSSVVSGIGPHQHPLAVTSLTSRTPCHRFERQREPWQKKAIFYFLVNNFFCEPDNRSVYGPAVRRAIWLATPGGSVASRHSQVNAQGKIMSHVSTAPSSRTPWQMADGSMTLIIGSSLSSIPLSYVMAFTTGSHVGTRLVPSCRAAASSPPPKKDKVHSNQPVHTNTQIKRRRRPRWRWRWWQRRTKHQNSCFYFIFLVVPPFASPPPFHTDIVYIPGLSNIADLEPLPDVLYDNRSAYPASLGIASSYALRQKIDADSLRGGEPALHPTKQPPLAIAGSFLPPRNQKVDHCQRGCLLGRHALRSCIAADHHLHLCDVLKSHSR